MHENRGGIVTSGHLIVFSASDDTAGREDKESVRELVESARSFDMSALKRPTVRTSAVVLSGGDSTPAALAELFGESEWVVEAERAELGAAFKTLGIQTAKSVQGTYLLTYCSAACAGWHTVLVSVAGAESSHLIYEFDAQDFEGGCSTELFEPSCDSKSCGGFHCGACDDETEFCDGAETGQCISACLAQNACAGEEITNAFSYAMQCDLGDQFEMCFGQCADPLANNDHCGGCGNRCDVDTNSCVEGVCRCETGELACSGECVDESSDNNNCGACGQICGYNKYCAEGKCMQGPHVSVGCDHVCGINNDDIVICWGLDDDGQSTPPPGRFLQVSVGGRHTCGIKNDGSVACWGSDIHGQATPPPGHLVQVSMGGSYSCGVKSDGSVACWGLDDDGQMTPPSG